MTIWINRRTGVAHRFDRLNELVRWGWIKAPKADALAGFLVRGGEGHKQSTWYSQWAALRELGIVIDPLARERSAVPVGMHFERWRNSWPRDEHGSA